MPNFSKYLLAIIILIMLSAIAYLQNRGTVTSSIGKINRNVSGFYNGISKINEYLFHLSNECRRGQFDVAQNTFLDMQQHWQRLDVLVKTNPETHFDINYWPSDSLRNLEKYLNELYLSNEREQYSLLIIKEIKRINSKIDQMQELKTTGKKH